MNALDNLPADARPWLSDISLWEVATLVERRRLSFSIPFDEWLDAAVHPRTVRLVSISPAIANAIATLPSSFHRDPADRTIVATCRALNLPIVTRDRRISGSRLVRRWTFGPGRPVTAGTGKTPEGADGKDTARSGQHKAKKVRTDKTPDGPD